MHVNDFAGRGASVRSLCGAFLSGAPVHAILLVGAKGVGRRTLAGTLAQSLYCTGEGEKPCGQCPACKRYKAGSHPDAHRIEAKKRIGVDEIRELIMALQSAAYEGGFRTVIIEEADSMTTQAQNSLLKTLEEPPPQTVFFLTATSTAALLPTIVSRCRVVQVPPMPQAAVEQILQEKGIAPGRSAQLATMAQGSIGRAIQLDGDEAYWALRAKVLDTMAAAKCPGDILLAVNRLKDDKADAGSICEVLEGTLRSALYGVLGEKPADPAVDGWEAALARLPAGRITKLIQKVCTMRQMLASNVAWPAVWERFLLEYMEETEAWQS